MFIAIIVSLLTGVTLVTSRVANAKLAEYSSTLTSTFYNYFVGLIVSLIALMFLGHEESSFLTSFSTDNLWIYSGGLISIFVVFISTAVAPKIPTFYMTLLLFVGQLFASVIIDTFRTHHFSLGQIIGGAFVAIGFTFNLMIDRKTK